LKEFWNNRYGEKGFAYGILPNTFFKEQLLKLKPTRILLPAEGEGRNAVFAAKSGWNVTAFDMSENARIKAMALAETQKAEIEYKVCSVMDFQTENLYDAIGLIYAHFPKTIRPDAHKKMASLLKPGGTIILEGFAKQQLGLSSGGPKNEEMLFSINMIKKEFPDIDFNILVQKEIFLNEGRYHKGIAQVIQMRGIKTK